MSQYWLIITLIWFGSASSQYINMGGPDTSAPYPLQATPHVSYAGARSEPVVLQNDHNLDANDFYRRDEDLSELLRRRRSIDQTGQSTSAGYQWRPNFLDVESSSDHGSTDEIDENTTPLEKRSFSPWGGKRNEIHAGRMLTWKRAVREPSMPKRVRFSPWGGKRSGHKVYKPGADGAKVIFSASIPELTRIVSNYLPKAQTLDMAGFKFVPTQDKRHPIKILALSTQIDHRSPRDPLPFNAFLDNLPKTFKLGHPYLDVNLKKDGKRKVKFSAWGGKRSPPIIGPIWTPTPEDLKDADLNSIVIIRNDNII
ncbi:uncharacterized protein LOC126977289 [Leptidea sinapis]|uniref:uncharacterized protein LOC126977289 n=1 Tax=Leptidea sinapis TaxID=189913 RepID=UPI0021387A74|nr:uncharacterized protein LOC126977289 [Leptidea sinapis]